MLINSPAYDSRGSPIARSHRSSVSASERHQAWADLGVKRQRLIAFTKGGVAQGKPQHRVFHRQVAKRLAPAGMKDPVHCFKHRDGIARATLFHEDESFDQVGEGARHLGECVAASVIEKLASAAHRVCV